MFKNFVFITSTLVMLFFSKSTNATDITLVYDESSSLKKSQTMFFAANWNPVTGVYVTDWNQFKRYPMFDDGKHGDKGAGDGIWAVKVKAKFAPVLYEWALDKDNDTENGWLGNGTSFKVASNDPLQVHFMELPIEAKLTREQLELKLRYGLSIAKAPTICTDGKTVIFTVFYPNAKQVYLAGDFNNFAENQDGIVNDPRYRMFQLENDIWIRILKFEEKEIRFKYVIRDKNDQFHWKPDPSVKSQDKDYNSILKLGQTPKKASQ